MKKTTILITVLVATAFAMASCSGNQNAQNAVNDNQDRYSDKEALENIFERKSVRKFQDRVVEDEKIDLMVRAGMAAPSAMDRRPWEIIVLNDREILDRFAEELKYGEMLKMAPMAIVVCGDSERSSFWYIDCSAVTQNILLAAEALDLGAVWTGAYPSEERAAAIASTLGLPEHVLPVAVIPVGYPDGEHQPKDKYDAAKVHYNRW